MTRYDDDLIWTALILFAFAVVIGAAAWASSALGDALARNLPI
jgi:hypothetical protein